MVSSFPMASSNFCLTFSRCAVIFSGAALSSWLMIKESSRVTSLTVFSSAAGESKLCWVESPVSNDAAEAERFTESPPEDMADALRLRCVCLHSSTSSRAFAFTGSIEDALASWFTLLPMSVSLRTFVGKLPISRSDCKAWSNASWDDDATSKTAFNAFTSSVMASTEPFPLAGGALEGGAAGEASVVAEGSFTGASAALLTTSATGAGAGAGSAASIANPSCSSLH
mmetsp:Transcript_41923/g.115607  ORF Transcript_41923/g.115607 Transcript_41923/m.115607 type:complete len:227 (+) Transcript_41923:537-1217(+)